MGVGRWHRPVVISANGGAGRAVGEKAVGGHHHHRAVHAHGRLRGVPKTATGRPERDLP